MLLLLHESDVDFNQPGLDCVTAMHVAASLGETRSIEFFLNLSSSTGSRRQVRLDPKDIFGRTPLDYAKERGQTKVVDLLLRQFSLYSFSIKE